MTTYPYVQYRQAQYMYIKLYKNVCLLILHTYISTVRPILDYHRHLKPHVGQLRPLLLYSTQNYSQQKGRVDVNDVEGNMRSSGSSSQCGTRTKVPLTRWGV